MVTSAGVEKKKFITLNLHCRNDAKMFKTQVEPQATFLHQFCGH